MLNAYEQRLKDLEQREPAPGMLVWTSEGAFVNRLCVVVSVSGDRAMIRALGGNTLNWIQKSSLDTDTEIK